MRKALSYVLLSLLPFICLSQQVSFIKYTVYDGLVANPVRCIYQDSKGFIWIGTYDGLSRYDGYKFTNFTAGNGISHNVINSLLEVDGKVLVGENNGALDIFENNIFVKSLKANSAINIVSRSADEVLLTTDANGFYKFQKDSIRLIRQQSPLSSLGHFMQINDSLLLVDGVDGELYLYDKRFNIVSAIKDSVLHFYTFLKDSKNRIWTCTSEGLKQLSVKPGEKNAISFLPLPPAFNFEPLSSAPVTSMVEEKDGSIWIGTYKGLVRLFPNGNFHVYNEKDGLPSSRIEALHIDSEKNLWIGTSLGLAKWVSQNNVVFFSTETQDFRNDLVSVSADPDQKIILKTDHGLQQFNFETREFKNIKVPGDSYPIPIAGTSPLLIQYADWIGKYNPDKNSVSPVRKLDTLLPGPILAAMHPREIIFVGAYGGLYAIHASSFTKILPHRVTSLVIDKQGFAWVGTWAEGLFRIVVKDQAAGLYEVKEMTDSVHDRLIRGLYVDKKENIWVGTRYSGAFCFTPKAKDQYGIQHFNRQSGLMSDWVISFGEATTDDMWVGTYLGIDRLVKEPAGYRVFNFSKAVNFFAEIKKIVPFKDHWICVANSGIAIFKDENLHRAPPLTPRIFSVSLGVREDKITIHSPTGKISLKPYQNAANFEFGALGFINERQIMYSYRLKGSSDTTWSKPANIHEASYESLSPGNYSFEVKTIGWNGEAGEPTSFSFFISTPFWKQWWFIVLCAMVIAGLFYALYRYRINQLLRLQTVRNNIATDLHDDIGSSLTNISILSELSSKNLAEPEKAKPFLQRISEEVQASSQAMDDIIWSVNSHNDSLQETMARMRRYAAELFDNGETNCHMQLDENSGNKKLTIEQRRDVYLIYKEALNNIHKHARAKNVWIEVRQNHNYLLMKIKDDGQGFNTEIVTHRNGLKNLGSRVGKWNGRISISSAEQQGTTIEVKMPLKD